MATEFEATQKILQKNAPANCPRLTGEIDEKDFEFGTAKIMPSMSNKFAMQCTGCVNGIRFGAPQIIPAYTGQGVNVGEAHPACVGCSLKEGNIYDGTTGISIFSIPNQPQRPSENLG